MKTNRVYGRLKIMTNRWLRLLPVLSFVNGMVLMIFELVAARLLAPTIGSSTYVWTSVIGVIIAMLALGVWIGGRIADRRGVFLDVAYVLLFAAFFVATVITASSQILGGLAYEQIDLRLKGVIASLLLFAPTSFLLGITGPYLAKLNVRSLDHTGRSVANLDAMNALGGIVGTFITGFILFSVIGSKSILTALVCVLVAASWVIEPKKSPWYRWALTGAALVLAFLIPAAGSFIHIDTTTAHYVVVDLATTTAHKRLILTGPGGYQSGVDVNAPDTLIFWYAKEIAAVMERVPKKDRILVLGGGAYTIPRYLAAQYPTAQIDVVEIDPALVGIAKQYFFYDNPSNVTPIADDARTYIDTTKQTYDVVIVDVYNDAEVPFTVLTKEYGESVRRVTRPGGVVIANSIADDTGSCKEFLQATFKPYLDHFSQGFYHKNDTTAGVGRTNIISAFSDADLRLGDSYKLATAVNAPIYTDDFAPAEALQFGCTKST